MQDINLNLRARRAAFTALLAKRVPPPLPSLPEAPDAAAGNVNIAVLPGNSPIEYRPVGVAPSQEVRH